MIDIKEIAKKVIAEEASAVQRLAGFIDEDFEKVVELIYRNRKKCHYCSENRSDLEFNRHSVGVYACCRCHSRRFGYDLPG